MGRVQDKIILLTGGAMGLGKAAARRLVEEGARVLITDHNAEAGAATAAELGDNVDFLEQDVTNPERWTEVIAHVAATYGQLDVLVNNAAVTVFGSIADSIFLGCKTALPLMSKTGGSIINLSSAAAINASADLIAYNSAKAAIPMLTKSIALYCAREKNGVRVNAVLPGTIMTPNVRSVIDGTPNPAETEELFQLAQPVGHMGEPDDIAHLIVYLASNESKFATGAAFAVDGGLSI